MKSWNFVDQDDHGNDILCTVTEEEIIEKYYPYWKEEMRKRQEEGCENTLEINLDDEEEAIKSCIEDFVVINWAWEDD